MKNIETILTRRSVREFKPDPLKKEDVDAILECAFASPSAMNCRPWHLIVIDDKKVLGDVKEVMGPPARMLETAPMAILVLGNKELSRKDFYIIDCALLAENILVGARAVGVGSCYIGTYPKEAEMAKLKEYFKLPDHLVPHSLIALGYPKDNNAFYKKHEIEKEKLTFNKYK